MSAWLWPFVDGSPPVGWDEAFRYLVLPVLLVVFQFVSTAIISPPVQQEDEEKNNALQKGLTVGLPFMVGWFALNLPAGLSLYYFSNITLTSAQQIWLRKLGGGLFDSAEKFMERRRSRLNTIGSEAQVAPIVTWIGSKK